MQDRYEIGRGPMENLERTIEAMDALNWMLYITLEAGDPLNHIAGGINTLFQAQCRDLEKARLGILDEEKNRSKFAPISMASENSNRSSVAISREAAEPELNKVREVSADYERLQEEFIADQIEAGKTVSEIGSAMALHRSAVQRIIDRMPDRATREHFDALEGRSPVRRLRENFIADRIAEGVDTSMIAQSLNMKASTVERVIKKLLGAERPNIVKEDAA